LDAFRRTRYAVTLLILIMALFVSAETAFIQNAEAAPTVGLSPSPAIPGQLITVTLSGFSLSDTSCSISGTPVSNPSSCTLSIGSGSLKFTVTQYTPPGIYTITVTGSTSDSGQASLTVTGFTLTLTKTTGPVGTVVSFTISGVPLYDTSCSVSALPSSVSGSLVIVSPACSVSAGSGGGTFTIGNVPAGDYTIEVTACTGNNGCAPSAGDFAQAVFNVTSGKPEPTIALSPTSAIPGTLITVTLTLFSSSDTSCTISGTPVANPSACTLSGGSGTLTFTVKQYAPVGTYTITVTGNVAGDSASQIFTVNGFDLVLSPNSGETGTNVKLSMTNVPLYDTSCSISSTSSPNPITNPGCAVSGGVGNGTFVVGNVPLGDYVIEVTACTGNNGCPPSAGDFAQQVFNVTSGPFIQLTGIKGGYVSLGQVASGPHGTHVSISGSDFLARDALNSVTCSVSSPSGSVIVGGACSFFVNPLGFVNVTGSFVVGNVAEGQYVIQVSGAAGDSAQAVFNVTAGAFIQLGTNGVFAGVGKVASGPIGTHVDIEGSQFLPNDALNSATCSIGSPSNGAVIANGGCSFFKTASGFVNATGSFVIGNVPEGQYVIQVSGSAGDSAQAVLNVTAGAFIQLGVNGIYLHVGQVQSGPIGTHVSIEGSQFLANDAFNSATCSVSSPSNGAVIQNGGCSFFKTPTGFVNVTGSFVVGNVAEGQYVIQVSGSAGDSAQAVFNVTAGAFIQLGVNGVFVKVGKVASGPTGTHVSIEGSQFLANDAFNSATCSISSPTSGSVLVGNACSFFKTTGGYVNVTGSFVVGNVAEGQYVIQVSGSAGDSAQAVFNVTAGAFIQLGTNGVFVNVGKVASGPIGTHVDIEGSQFLPNDALNGATCSLGSPSNGAIVDNGACAFFKTTSGFVNVTGSFVVGNVPEGQYAIQVSGGAGDSARAVFNVTAGAFIQLGTNGRFAGVGQVASGPIGTHVSIEGSQFLPNDAFNSATCSIGSPSNGAIVLNGGCSFFKTTSGYVNATGSFVVGNVPEGQYVIQVSGSAGDSAQAVFNVTAGAFIQLSVNGIVYSLGQAASGPIGTHVTIMGSQFLPGDAFNSATCSVSSPSNGAAIVNGACAFFKTTAGLVNATGSFVVGNVQEGQYVIQVSGSAGDSAQAILNVTAGAFIQLGVSPGGFVSVGHTAKGPVGTAVSIEGSQFLPGDAFNSATCTVSSPTRSTIISGGACSFFKTTTGLVNVTGSFLVGNVVPGQYVIQVSGSAGDSAQAIFNVTTGPFIQLRVAGVAGGFASLGQVVSGPLGASVSVEGSYFVGTTTTCTLSSPTSATALTGAACSTFIPSSGPFLGFANVTGSFIIGNVLPGQYVLQVTTNDGSFAQAVFNVTLGAQITLSPGTAKEPGYNVIVNGTGFLPTDTACVLSSPGSNAVEGGTAACSVRAGTGVISGSFVVGNVLPGQYVIQVTGSQGDFATAVLTVPSGPTLALSPGTGMVGTTIAVNGTSFLATDQSCSISSTSTPNPILLGSAACAITVGFGPTGGNPHGSFVIGAIAPGEYVIEVTACAGNNGCAPSAGDFAQAVLNVTQGAPTTTLTPGSAVEESTVVVVATGLNPSDTGCSILASPTNTLLTSSTCSITSPGIAQGTFVVSPYATSDIKWLVSVKGSPIGDLTPTEPFTVTPDIIVVPTSGTVNTVFTYTGSGFESDATTCTAVVVPAFTSVSSGVGASTPTCSVDGTTGQVSGSVVVPKGAQSGTYGIMVTDSTMATATGEFTVGTPSALVVLNPASVDQDEPVGVAGTGFNPNDTYCVITSGSTPPWVDPTTGTADNGVAPNCAIASGYASGSFVVSNTAPGGYYLITIQACSAPPITNPLGAIYGQVCPSGDALDFASNFLGVTLATTVTTYSTTTTSSSTTTSLSTTTTSLATSFSYSSTTYSTTGILFTTYTHFTYTTVSGQTTTTYTQTSSTTQTQTTVTATTTTSFTTVGCGPLPCGFAVQPTTNPAPGIDGAGLLAALLLVIPILLRRLFG